MGISVPAGLHAAPATLLHRLNIGNADDAAPTVVAASPRCVGGLNDRSTGCLVCALDDRHLTGGRTNNSPTDKLTVSRVEYSV